MQRLLSKLKQIDDALARAEAALVAAGIALMVVLAAGQVLLRFFTSGFPWADQLARFLVLWTAILGAALATGRRKHITIDIVTKSLSEKGRAVVDLAANALGILLCAFLCVVCAAYVQVNFENGTLATTLPLPIWTVQVVLPYGFLSMAFRFLTGLLEDAEGLRTGSFAYLHRYETADDVHAAEQKVHDREKEHHP